MYEHFHKDKIARLMNNDFNFNKIFDMALP